VECSLYRRVSLFWHLNDLTWFCIHFPCQAHGSQLYCAAFLTVHSLPSLVKTRQLVKLVEEARATWATGVKKGDS
jgi:hypothetical protein